MMKKSNVLMYVNLIKWRYLLLEFVCFRILRFGLFMEYKINFYKQDLI